MYNVEEKGRRERERVMLLSHGSVSCMQFCVDSFVSSHLFL